MFSVHIIVAALLMSCGNKANASSPTEDSTVVEKPYVNVKGEKVKDRFLFDSDKYVRRDSSDYAEYLRSLPLKPHGYPTHYYNGRKKVRDVGVAVIDMEIGKENLQQCADAVIRLRAEYLFRTRQYVKIHYNFTNGFRCDYTKWAEGYRIKANSAQTKTWWKRECKADKGYPTFRKYLDQVFLYAGTASLRQELQKISWRDVKPGDVIIQGGHPGHAITVLDVLHPVKAGLPVRIMLCQSYMPAQEIEILRANDGSPWFELPQGNGKTKFVTPEWTFTYDDFYRFK